MLFTKPLIFKYMGQGANLHKETHLGHPVLEQGANLHKETHLGHPVLDQGANLDKKTQPGAPSLGPQDLTYIRKPTWGTLS